MFQKLVKRFFVTPSPPRLAQESTGSILTLKLYPGQELFSGMETKLAVTGGQISIRSLFNKDRKAFYTSLLKDNLKPTLIGRLGKLGFCQLTSQHPQSFLIVKLVAEQEQLIADITMAAKEEPLSSSGSTDSASIEEAIRNLTMQVQVEVLSSAKTCLR
jgi:hypothetical protein